MTSLDVRPPTTRRDILRQLGAPAASILLASLASLLAPLVNAAVIGHVRPAGLYILALLVPVLLLQNAVNDSLRVSAVAFSSQASGNGEHARFGRRLQAVITLGVLINLAIALAFLGGHRWFADLYAIPAGRRELAFHFIQLNILTGTLLMISIGMMSALYGFGRVRAVTVMTVTSVSLSVLLTALLVSWVGLFALPISTTVTATGTICWAARQLAKLGALPRPRGALFGPVADNWREITRISLPVSLGYLALFVNGLLFTRILTVFSADDIAGFGIGYRIQNLLLMPAIAIGVALAISVNRMVAAGQMERVSTFISTALLTSSAILATLATVVMFSRSVLTGLMSSNQEIADAASTYLAYLAPAYIVVGPMLTLTIFLEETGNGVRALRFSVLLIGLQLALAGTLAHAYHSLPQVYLATSLCNLVAIGFIVHELHRVRRLRGHVSAVNSR